MDEQYRTKYDSSKIQSNTLLTFAAIINIYKKNLMFKVKCHLTVMTYM